MINVELFEGLKPSIILNDVINHMDNCLGSLPESEFNLKLISIVGSRLKGTHHEDSDLDIAISYKGSLRENDCFNELMEYPLFIERIKVDFLPYSEEKGNFIDINRPYYFLYYNCYEKDKKNGISIENKTPFDEEKMKRLVMKDVRLNFVFHDLTNRKVTVLDALKVIFFGFVQDDSELNSIYTVA
jgi:predicted nucleotidyltransferase